MRLVVLYTAMYTSLDTIIYAENLFDRNMRRHIVKRSDIDRNAAVWSNLSTESTVHVDTETSSNWLIAILQAA